MTKLQLKEKIQKHLESIKPSSLFRIGVITFEIDDRFQIITRVHFRFNDDFDFSGNFVINKRQLQLILAPDEYEQLVQLIIDDIKD